MAEISFEEILADPQNMRCKCADEAEGKPPCELRGKCKECIAAHRFLQGLPNCLRPNAEDYPTPPLEGRKTHAEIFADPENLRCKCEPELEGKQDCEFRTKCRECIAIHRFFKGLPACVRTYAVIKS